MPPRRSAHAAPHARRRSRGGAVARWSPEELAAHQAQRGRAERSVRDGAPIALAEALGALGLGARVGAPGRRKAKGPSAGTDPSPPPTNAEPAQTEAPGATTTAAPKTTAKKRKGVSTAPIFRSLAQTPGRACWGPTWLAVDLPGARLLTYNELFSILQFRKHESFRYKKICRQAIERALQHAEHITGQRPYFDGPARLTYIRVGAKEMDRDALPIVFKYFLDALKTFGVIADDNPNIIADIVSVQHKGPPRLAMRLDRLTDWTPQAVPTWADWTDVRDPLAEQMAARPALGDDNAPAEADAAPQRRRRAAPKTAPTHQARRAPTRRRPPPP